MVRTRHADLAVGQVWTTKTGTVRIVDLVCQEDRRGRLVRMVRLVSHPSGRVRPKPRSAQYLRRLVQLGPDSDPSRVFSIGLVSQGETEAGASVRQTYGSARRITLSATIARRIGEGR